MSTAVGESEVGETLRRSAIYRLLALAFAYPMPDRIAEVAAAADHLAGGADGALAEALARLAASGHEADPGSLAGEYLDLFDRGVRCPPYEGAYGPAQLGGKATMLADVAGFYAAFGLEPTSGQPDMEDHIAAQLEFMSVLALKEAWALAEGLAGPLAVTRDAQSGFLAQHLGRWAPAFAARVTELAAPGLYPAAVGALSAWLADDCARLGIVAAPLDGVQESEPGVFTCPMVAGDGDAVDGGAVDGGGAPGG